MDVQNYLDNINIMNIINERNGFMKHNHVRLTELEENRAVAEVTVVPDSLNPYNTVHGGVYFTLADCVAGAAARSDGMRYVTLNSSMEFIRSAKEGVIRATSAVRHRGRTTCLVAVEITDGEGKLLAEGKFTMFCMRDPVNLY